MKNPCMHHVNKINLIFVIKSCFMKKAVVFFLVLFLSVSLNAQISSRIFDKATNQPVSYANIWCNTGKCGATANDKGYFKIIVYDDSKELTITSVGYKKKTIETQKISDSIFLEQDIIKLSEVLVTSKKKETLKLGKIKNSSIELCVTNDYSVRTLGRYFPNNFENNEDLYVKKVKVKTYALLKNTILNIQFYSINDNGTPDVLLYHENIICEVKHGTNTTEIDVSKLNIEFPKKGIVVAFENLLVEQNKLEMKYQLNNTSELKTLYIYEPRIKVIDNNGFEDTWSFNGDKWVANNKGHTISMELILTN